MITFLTLYLGLIVGPRQFELAVPEAAARVEVLLDVSAELTFRGRLRTQVGWPRPSPS